MQTRIYPTAGRPARLASAVRAAAFAAFVLFIASALPAAPRPYPLPDLEPSAWALEAAGAPDPMPVSSFVKAALDFSAAEATRRTGIEAKLAALLDDAAAEAAKLADPYARGEALLAFLHERVFARYVENQTLVDAALDSGAYNCVSSAVVYAAFAKAIGLDVSGVATVDHAFCAVDVGNGKLVDVETTNPYGFDPGTKKEFTDSFGNATGYAYTPPGAYSRRRAIGERELLSLVLRNRVTLAEQRGRWEDAFSIAVDVHAFLGTAESAEFLRGRLSNLVSALNQASAFDETLRFVAAFEKAYGADAATAKLADLTSHNLLASLGSQKRWEDGVPFAEARVASGADADGSARDFLRASVLDPFTAFVRQKRWAEAEALLERIGSRLPPDELASTRALLHDAKTADAVMTKPFADAEKEVETAYSAGYLTKARYGEFIEYLYNKESVAEAKRSGWLAGAAVLERGLSKIPGNATLRKNRTIMRDNYVAETHNKFAALYNAGRFKEAKDFVEAALKLVPDSKRLKDDLSLAVKALNG